MILEQTDKEYINDYINVPIYFKTDFLSWEDAILDKFGPLFGYSEDLQNNNIESVLKNILFGNTFVVKLGTTDNYNSIYEIYKSYIENLKPDNVEENKSKIEEYDKELEKLNFPNGSVEILKKYGIIEGINLKIPYSKLTKDYAILMGEDATLTPQINSLYNKYKQDIELNYMYTPDEGVYYLEKNINVKVLVFSRAEGTLIDITRNISQLTTNVTKTGGNFSLQYNLAFFEDMSAYADDQSLAGAYSWKAAYIQSIFRENDLIFIKFEKLKLEEENTRGIGGEKEDHVANGLWDMIGLIDQTVINSTPTNLSITIEGRDLSKLLIEDQNIFIPYQFANSQETTFGGTSSKIFKRLFATGEYKLQFIYSLRSIETTMGFIFHHLTNIEILTDKGNTLFKNEYGDRLQKAFTFDNSGKVESKESIPGIWGIIKFAVDEKIKHYRIADSSISSPDGSIMSQLQKLAQEPFVELQYDTFGDMYNIIARRPPWDRESIKNSTCLSISSSNSISDTLALDTEVFSIFQIQPQGALLGGANSLPLSYIPMIVLDKYVEIWGNKFFSSVYNYIDFNTYCKVYKGTTKRNPKETFIDDLCWLIEVMAIKPFTRRGTITLKGDRRIKRGMWIHYQKTNEIFYVDAVQNSASITNRMIDRTTTLQVSRGMVLGFVETLGIKKEYLPEEFTTQESYRDLFEEKKGIYSSTVYLNEDASYFNLIDTKFIKESLKRNLIEVTNAYTLKKEIKVGNKEEYKQTESVVNEKVFDFFLKGAQFWYKFKKQDSKIDNSENTTNIAIKVNEITNQVPIEQK